jgi:hypothetical protein
MCGIFIEFPVLFCTVQVTIEIKQAKVLDIFIYSSYFSYMLGQLKLMQHSSLNKELISLTLKQNLCFCTV